MARACASTCASSAARSRSCTPARYAVTRIATARALRGRDDASAARQSAASPVSPASAPDADSRPIASATSPRAARPSISAQSLPVNAAWPVRISQRIEPSAKTSARLSSAFDLAARLLRRHVGRRPQHAPRPRRVGGHGAATGGDLRLLLVGPPRGAAVRLVAGQHLGQAPVHHLDLAEAPDHDVRRLQVAVDHAPSVRIGHRLADRLEDPHQPRQAVGRAGARGQQLGERPPLDQPHGDIRATVGQAPQLVDRHDPGVLQLPADLRLLDEPAHHVGLVVQGLPQHLDGQVAAQVGIVRPEHHAHAAAAQHVEELQSPGTRRRLDGRRSLPRAAILADDGVRQPDPGTRPIERASVARRLESAGPRVDGMPSRLDPPSSRDGSSAPDPPAPAGPRSAAIPPDRARPDSGFWSRSTIWQPPPSRPLETPWAASPEGVVPRHCKGSWPAAPSPRARGRPAPSLRT